MGIHEFNIFCLTDNEIILDSSVYVILYSFCIILMCNDFISDSSQSPCRRMYNTLRKHIKFISIGYRVIGIIIPFTRYRDHNSFCNNIVMQSFRCRRSCFSRLAVICGTYECKVTVGGMVNPRASSSTGPMELELSGEVIS